MLLVSIVVVALAASAGKTSVRGCDVQDEISQNADDVWTRACRVIADLSRYVIHTHFRGVMIPFLHQGQLSTLHQTAMYA